MDNDALKIGWVVLAVLVSAAEIFVPGFFLLPFGLGAGVGAIAAFAGASFAVQLLAFVLSSAIFFALLRPIAGRMNRAADPTGVGANRLLHLQGVVVDRLGPDDPGMVRVDREDWRAESAQGDVLEVGTRVRVIEVRGTRVIVEPDSETPGDLP